MRAIHGSARILLLWCALLAGVAVYSHVAAQQTVLEVIPLRYRAAEQVIPVLEPMLAREGSISAFQNQLIVRTTPANMAELKRILASIDTAPRRLLVTVRQDAGLDRARREAEVSGSVSAGDRARVTVPPGSRDDRGLVVERRQGSDELRARVLDSRSSETDRNAQTIQVLEGNSALIRIGRSVPFPARRVVRSVVGGQIVEQVVDSVEYRDVVTGFQVLPRVTGDWVTLDVSPQRETLDPRRPGAIDVQRVTTTVSGRLGEWMEIGGLVQDVSRQQSVLLGRTSDMRADRRSVLIKVEELR